MKVYATAPCDNSIAVRDIHNQGLRIIETLEGGYAWGITVVGFAISYRYNI